jgi:colanic acid biosynthesis glycosyl transferase WcaI
MKILIYGAYFPPEQIGIGKYTGEMAQWLAQHGHDVRMVAAVPFYPMWQVMDGYKWWRYKRERHDEVVVWRCPIWVPRKPTAILRIVHLASFALSSLPVVFAHIFWRPDRLIVVSPPLFCTIGAWITARLTGAQAWLHLQDFEVDAAFASGLMQTGLLRRLGLAVERMILGRFNRVSTISEAMIKRLIEKGIDSSHCVLFPNWVDTNRIFPLAESALKRTLQIPPGTIVALYSGNMGHKQGLEILITVAKLLSSVTELRFVLCGEGAMREELERQADGLTNIRWLPLQPAERINDLLNTADIHLLPQKADIADVVMPSKLTGILASGKPFIATAFPETELAKVAAQCGVAVRPGDPEALAEAILALSKDSARRNQLGAKSREFAVTYLERERVMSTFEKNLSSGV